MLFRTSTFGECEFAINVETVLDELRCKILHSLGSRHFNEYICTRKSSFNKIVSMMSWGEGSSEYLKKSIVLIALGMLCKISINNLHFELNSSFCCSKIRFRENMESYDVEDKEENVEDVEDVDDLKEDDLVGNDGVGANGCDGEQIILFVLKHPSCL